MKRTQAQAAQGTARQRCCDAWIGLGANLGDPAAAVRHAFAALSALPRTRLLARSSLYRSAPVEASGPDFVNAVAHLTTGLTARELLAQLHAIERRHGRERAFRNAPRTLDLDLLLYDDEVVASTDLTLPHPRMHRRAFVLVPLAELAPQATIPGLGSIACWLPGVAGQAIERLAGPEGAVPTRPGRAGLCHGAGIDSQVPTAGVVGGANGGRAEP